MAYSGDSGGGEPLYFLEGKQHQSHLCCMGVLFGLEHWERVRSQIGLQEISSSSVMREGGAFGN